MVKIVDSNELFSKCMIQSIDERLTARTVATYLTSPFAIYCHKFVPEEEKDEMSEYQKLLFQRGNEHEIKTVYEKYPDLTTIHFESPEEGFKSTLESMFSGTDVLHGMPLYYLPDGLYGISDILEKSNTHSSIFGNYHYIVKEVKLAKNIQEEHLLQGAFYNYLLGQIQGRTPETFVMINRDGEESLHEYSEYASLLFDCIEGTRKIFKGESVSPTYGSCEYPWKNYCNKKAIDTNDISLVAGISAKTKGKFVDSGYKTVQDLAGAKLEDLIDLKGVGKKSAIKYVTTAKALHTNEPIIIDKDAIDFPDKKVEIFLDLEGIDPTMADENTPQIDYLIGILVRENSEEKYIPFTAKKKVII